MKGASRPCLCGYMRAAIELCRSLDGALTVASAQPVGQAARGFVVELLAGGSRVAASDDAMPHDTRRQCDGS
jgi:hypothetical protein